MFLLPPNQPKNKNSYCCFKDIWQSILFERIENGACFSLVFQPSWGVTLPSITLAPLLRGFTMMFSSSWCVKRPKNRPTFQRNVFQRAELLIYSALQLHADTLKYKTRSPCQMHLSGCFPVATLEKESGLRWSSTKVPSAGKTVSSNASSEAPATSVCREEC